MCGIVGIYTYKRDVKRHEKFVRWSMGQMLRRGPDSDGYYKNEYIAFGFRRLAIRDTSKNANQPMVDNDTGCVLVFNGEIYNTNYLKGKLSSDICFRTNSDTEVLLRCLVDLGPDIVLPLLDGIFAFSFYDPRDCRFVLARDRCGVKPLYFGQKNNTLVFCSEYSHILCHDDFSKERVNIDALGQYLQLGFVPDGDSIFTNTYLLQHGCYLSVIRDQTPKLIQYYNYPWHCDLNHKQSLGNIVAESVYSQLVSDVPVGVFQSGGIDSSVVACNAISLDPTLESFTIGVGGNSEMDESKIAKAFASHLGMKNNIYRVDGNDSLLDLIDQNTEAFSEPFADYSSLPTLMLSKFARKKITVALSGDGGDELFWGYKRNVNTANLLRCFKGNKLLRAVCVVKNRISMAESIKVPFELLRYSSFQDYAFQRTFITGAKKWYKKLLHYEPSPPFFMKCIFEESGDDNYLTDVEKMNLLRKIEFDFHLQRVLLKVDRTSLYHSLEVRVPLLSNQMLNVSLQYAYNECISSQMGKIPLRNTLERCAGPLFSKLPKKGFTVPIDDWIQSILAKRITERLVDIPELFSTFFDDKAIIALLRSPRSHNSAWVIWALFTLFEWADKTLYRQRVDYNKFDYAFHCTRRK